MTAYKNFVHDFPLRCRDLLALEPDLRNVDREVTLLIAVASSGFLVPFERLQLGNPEVPHLSKDKQNYEATANALGKILDDPFVFSTLCGNREYWFRGKVTDLHRFPDEWGRPKPIGSEARTGTILKIIRRGLAHGNVWTRGSPEGQITGLVFAGALAGGTKYDSVEMPPSQFSILLNSWFAALEELQMNTVQAAAVMDMDKAA
jgi:hypothetical protein